MMSEVIIITGSRKGIGRYLSEYYSNIGMSVIGCSRTQSDYSHQNYEHYCVDVTQEEAVISMISSIYKKYKKIDILINNAGVASMNHSLLTPLSTVQKIFSTNVYGTFLMCREVGKVMSKKKYGRIINISTVGVPFRLEGEAIYTASKSAVEMLSKILSKEFAYANITVNTVAPTPAETDLIKNVPRAKIDDILQRQAIRRFSTFGDIMNVINFYIKPESDMISGQTLYLGGVS
jgi:3-oxoacyl-[acyl-carrier protein] reductase